MKKYKVEAQAITAEQLAGVEPWTTTKRFMVDNDYTEAQSADEAIYFVQSWLEYEHGYEQYRDDIYVCRDDEGNVIDGWAFFSAEEVK